VIDSLVGEQGPEDLCVENNDIALDYCNIIAEHCNFLNFDNIIDNTCLDNVISCDTVQDNYNLFVFFGVQCENFSDMNISSGLYNDCTFNGEQLMYYCVNNDFYNRFQCISGATEIAQGLEFSHVELKFFKFHCVYDCNCFNTQVYTGFSESLIKCLALNLSVYNFWVNYACDLVCTSNCLLKNDISLVARGVYPDPADKVFFSVDSMSLGAL
jgi:hypothetical protein